jgi:hypothetical protein
MDLKELIMNSYFLTIPARRCALAFEDTMEELICSIFISWTAVAFPALLSSPPEIDLEKQHF